VAFTAKAIRLGCDGEMRYKNGCSAVDELFVPIPDSVSNKGEGAVFQVDEREVGHLYLES